MKCRRSDLILLKSINNNNNSRKMKMKMKKKKKEWNGKVIKIVGKNVIGGRRYRNKMENKKKKRDCLLS